MNWIDPKAFLNWEFGHSERWAVECTFQNPPQDEEGYLKDKTAFRRWVEVTDGPNPIVRLGDNAGTIHLGNHRDRHSLRRWLDPAQSPRMVARLQLDSPHRTVSHGEIEFLRTALPFRLEGAPTVLLTDEIRQRAPGSDVALETWARRCVFSTGQRTFMLVATPYSEQDEHLVSLLLKDGKRLHCQLSKDNRREWLRAQECVEGTPVEPMARLLEITGFPHFLPELGDAPTISLAGLVPRMPGLLRYWIDYHRFEKERDRALFDRRLKTPLEFDDVVQGEAPGNWRVRIVNGGAALEAWASEEGKKGKPSSSIRSSISVLVRSRVTGRAPLEGTVQEMGQDETGAYALLTIRDSTCTPFENGFIEPKETMGGDEESRRRADALIRLLSGKSASPDLLAHLYMPSQVPESPGKRTSQRPKAPELEVFQREAVLGAAQEPPLFVIQGPPGTGKTFVIAEIISELMHRHRKPQSQDGAQPFTVLVASRQRDAVLNLNAALCRPGHSPAEVFLDDAWFDSDAAKEVYRTRKSIESRKWAEDLHRGFTRERDGYRRYQELKEWETKLDALGPALLPEGPVDVPKVHELLKGLRNHIVGRAMTNTLRQDLEGILLKVEDYIANLERRPAPEPIPRELREAVHDLVALAEEEPPPLLEGLEALGRIEDAVQRHQGSDLATLDLWATLLGTRLRRAAATGTPTPSLMDHWRTNPLMAAGSDPADGTLDPISWRDQALKWISRAGDLVLNEIRELDGTDDGILIRWVERLLHEPAAKDRIQERHAQVEARTTSRSARCLTGHNEGRTFDVVIIDEAARSGLDLLIPMTLGRSVILVGDHKQLPPYTEKAIEQMVQQEAKEGVATLEVPSLFAYLMQELLPRNRVVLDVQRRMHEDIGILVSRLFYEPDSVTLRHHYSGDRRYLRDPDFGVLDNIPLVWLDTSDRPRQALLGGNETTTGGESNPYEVSVVERLLEQMHSARTEDQEGGKSTGVITFYNQQRELLEALVDRRGWRDWVDVGTVDSFQGKEYPLVMLSCVRSGDGVGFLAHLPQRINVALSRAQRQLVIIGDSHTLCDEKRGSPWLREANKLIESGAVNGSIVRSREVLYAR